MIVSIIMFFIYFAISAMSWFTGLFPSSPFPSIADEFSILVPADLQLLQFIGWVIPLNFIFLSSFVYFSVIGVLFANKHAVQIFYIILSLLKR